jgi:hypothetical protein
MAIHLFKTATFYKSGRDGGHLETLEWGQLIIGHHTSVARWPPSRPLSSNVAVFKNGMAVNICGRQSGRERFLEGK